MAMKKLGLTCSMLLVLVSLTAPATVAADPNAGNFCMKWVAFCDGIQVNSITNNVINAEWYHIDCVNNTPMTGGSKGETPVVNNCPGPLGSGLIECAGCAGANYYFVIDAPLDGNLDFHIGTYPNGACGFNDLAYDMFIGPCVGLKQHGLRSQERNRSTVQ
jgi:hypothetical protein